MIIIIISMIVFAVSPGCVAVNFYKDPVVDGLWAGLWPTVGICWICFWEQWSLRYVWPYCTQKWPNLNSVLDIPEFNRVNAEWGIPMFVCLIVCTYSMNVLHIVSHNVWYHLTECHPRSSYPVTYSNLTDLLISGDKSHFGVYHMLKYAEINLYSYLSEFGSYF